MIVPVFYCCHKCAMFIIASQVLIAQAYLYIHCEEQLFLLIIILIISVNLVATHLLI